MAYSGNCRMGNWFEEKALVDNNVGPSDSYGRAFGETSHDPKNYVSTCMADFEHPSVNSYHFSEPEYGPREQKQIDDALAEGKRVVSSQQAIVERAAEQRFLSSTSKSMYTAPTDDFRRREVTVGRSVMKTRSGVPIEPRSTREIVPPEDDVPDDPVTIYSQRLVEGSVVSSGSVTSRAPFNKNTAFTNEVPDGMKHHAEGIDRSSNVVNPVLAGACRANGSELSVGALLAECRRHFSRDLHRSELEDAAGSLGPTLDVAAVAHLLRRTRVSLSYGERMALAAHFDGRDTAGIVVALVGESEGKEAETTKAAGTITVHYILKDGTLGECDVPAPRKIRLELPHDTSTVRALLRKQKIVPAHIEEIVYN